MPSAAVGARDTSYLVQRGDTTYAVARRFDIPVKSLIDANNLQPPYGLLAGQRLTIPRPRGHLVEPGDTVASVARHYGVDMSALVRANDLQPPYAALYSGAFHPTAEGHALVADHVVKHARTILDAKQAVAERQASRED